MKRTSVLVIIWFFLLPSYGKGQERSMPFKRTVKFFPLQLYRQFPAFAFGFEQKVGSRNAISIEAGFVSDFLAIGNENKNRRGVKLRQEFRHYYKVKYAKTSGTYSRGTYVSAELSQIIVDYTAEFRDRRWREFAFGARLGAVENLGRFCLEYSGGVSFRYAHETPPDLWASMVHFWRDRYPIVQPTFSFGVGYRLSRS